MRFILVFPFLFFFCVGLAEGGVIIMVQNAQLNAGGSGAVDVYISGQAGDLLGRFGYEFNITGATPQSGDLQFSVIQSGSAQNESGIPSYVFLGDTDPGNFLATRGSGGTDPVSLIGADVLATLNDISIDGTFLLARLALDHVGTLTAASHDFTISLNPISPFTVFDQDWDAGTDNNYATNQITAISGTVTVYAAAVPEPSGFVILAIAGGGVFWRGRKQRSGVGV